MNEYNALERRCREVNQLPASPERDRLARELQIDLGAAYCEMEARRIRTTNRVLVLIIAAVMAAVYILLEG